jgi:hypothetical protein
MKRTIAAITLLCLVSSQVAQADERRAVICAATLLPPARLVFDAVNARPQPAVLLRTLLEARVRELVFMDRLTISAARPAAEAASTCLRISRNCTAGNC